MSTDPIDYAAILADLEAKKAAVEAAIATLRSARAMGALGQSTDAGGAISVGGGIPSLVGGEVPEGAFLEKSIPEAAKLYLEIVKKKQTTRQIAEALHKGGMESTTSKNWLKIVHAALVRSRKSGALVKVGTHWGLAGWYPKGVASAIASPPKKGKKKNRKAAKDSAARAKETAVAAGPQIVSQAPVADRAPADRILEFLSTKPGTAFSAREIAERLELKVTTTPLTLANLVRSHKVGKTADGKYRAFIPEKMSAVV